MDEVMSNVHQFYYYTGKMEEIHKKITDKDTGEVSFEPDAQYKRKSTVCLLVNPETGDWARGVAVCSGQDNFSYKKGRAMALGRAQKALAGQKSCAENKMREAVFADSMLPAQIDNKCTYKTIPTDLEVKFIKQAIAAYENKQAVAKAA